MMNIIAWLIFGAIAGAIAKFLKPGADPGGWLVTIIIGIVGSIVGGFIGGLLFGKGTSNEVFSLYNMGMSVVGAIIVLFIYGKLTTKS